MAMTILKETFIEAKATPEEVGEFYAGIINGKVKVKSDGHEFEAWCQKKDSGLFVFGFIGKYRTGNKLWRVRLYLWREDPRTHCYFGRDDRCGRFNKSDLIFFDEKSYFFMK